MTSTRRKIVIFSLALALQLVVVLAIVLFPEKVKEEKYTDYEPLKIPRADVEYPGVPPNSVRKEIAEARIFRKYTGTRGIYVQGGRKAVVIITDRKFEEYIHFDRFMIDLSERGIASVLVDPREAPRYVPIDNGQGGYRSSEERQNLFFSELISYLSDLGFGDVSLWILGDRAATGERLVSSLKVISSLVMISARNFNCMTLPVPVLLISGSLDDALAENRSFVDSCREKGGKGDLLVLEGYTSRLVDLSGNIDKLTERGIYDASRNWAILNWKP